MCSYSSPYDYFISDDTGRIQSGQSQSHCGGGTGAEGWSVSPGRGAGGSMMGETWREKKKRIKPGFKIYNTFILKKKNWQLGKFKNIKVSFR